MNKENALKKVSESTLKEILKHDIVLPALYKDIFYEKIKEHDIEFEDDIDTSLQYASKKIKEYEEKVSVNANKLQKGMENATVAISNKDINEIEKIKEEIRHLQKELSQIKIELFKDMLTGVYNRKWLSEVYAKNGVFNTSGVMVFVDLDQFKEINDTYGHLAGDKILQFFGQNLSKCCNSNVKTLRYAGDEFIMIFEGVELSEAKESINTVKEKMDKKLFKAGKEKGFKITFSYGFAAFSKDDNISDVIEVADKNMYKLKKKLNR